MKLVSPCVVLAVIHSAFFFSHSVYSDSSRPFFPGLVYQDLGDFPCGLALRSKPFSVFHLSTWGSTDLETYAELRLPGQAQVRRLWLQERFPFLTENTLPPERRAGVNLNRETWRARPVSHGSRELQFMMVNNLRALGPHSQALLVNSLFEFMNMRAQTNIEVVRGLGGDVQSLHLELETIFTRGFDTGVPLTTLRPDSTDPRNYGAPTDALVVALQIYAIEAFGLMEKDGEQMLLRLREDPIFGIARMGGIEGTFSNRVRPTYGQNAMLGLVEVLGNLWRLDISVAAKTMIKKKLERIAESREIYDEVVRDRAMKIVFKTTSASPAMLPRGAGVAHTIQEAVSEAETKVVPEDSEGSE